MIFGWKKQMLMVPALLVLLALPLMSQEEKVFSLSLEELMEMEISTAARVMEKVEDIPANIQVITREEIRTYGYSSLVDILRQVRGLYTIFDFMDHSTGVRGYWSGVDNDSFIVQVNGVNQLFDYQSSYSLRRMLVPIEAIDRIEVVKGPSSVMYGTGALTGVINIITNDYSDLNDNEVSVSYGSDNSWRTGFNYTLKTSTVSATLSGSIGHTDGMEFDLADTVKNPEVLYGFGLSPDAVSKDQLERDPVGLHTSISWKNFTLDANYARAENEMHIFFPSFGEGTLSVEEQLNVALAWETPLNEKVDVFARVVYSNSALDNTYRNFFEDFDGGEKYGTDALDFTLYSHIHLSDKAKLTLGADKHVVTTVNHRFHLPSFGSPELVNQYYRVAPEDNVTMDALFGQLTYKVNENFSVVGGIRIEKQNRYTIETDRSGGTPYWNTASATTENDTLEPVKRLAAIYKVDDNNFMKIMYGEGMRHPTVLQNRISLLGPRPNFLKNEDIHTTEISYTRIFDENFSINFSLFRSELEHMIARNVLIFPDGNYETWLANSGEITQLGMEFTLDWHAGDRWTIDFSGTVQDSDDKTAGISDREMAYSPGIVLYLNAAYRLNENTSLAITGRYIDKMVTFYDDVMLNELGTFGARIGDPHEGYTVLDANLLMENILKEGLYLNLRVSNFLNTDYYYPTFTNNSWADRGTPGEEIGFMVRLGYRF